MFDVGDLPVLTFGNCVLKIGVTKWPLNLYARFITFLKSKTRLFKTFFELSHTFSRTLLVAIDVPSLGKTYPVVSDDEHSDDFSQTLTLRMSETSDLLLVPNLLSKSIGFCKLKKYWHRISCSASVCTNRAGCFIPVSNHSSLRSQSCTNLRSSFTLTEYHQLHCKHDRRSADDRSCFVHRDII